MSVVIDGTSGVTTPGVVNTAGETIATTLAVTGVSTFAAGTALLPALTTTGDTNTGLWFPAADTVAASTGGTECMRIDSSGSVLVGQTAAPLALARSCQVANASGSGQFSGGDSTLARTYSFGRDNVTTGSFVFTFNGSLISSINAATGVYTPVSDARLKKNITPINYGLNEILKLNPVMYNMVDESDDSKKHIGLIAQETKSVIDESVNDLVTVTQEMKDLGAKEQYYGLDKSVFVPVLIKAIQEQQALITQLQADVATLKALSA